MSASLSLRNRLLAVFYSFFQQLIVQLCIALKILAYFDLFHLAVNTVKHLIFYLFDSVIQLNFNVLILQRNLGHRTLGKVSRTDYFVDLRLGQVRRPHSVTVFHLNTVEWVPVEALV